jgi:MFS family permease
MTNNVLSVAAPSEIRRHWCAVAGCFVTAVFAWGFGFYGQAVYLSELHRLWGWSSFLIGSATTTFYLSGALLVTRVHLVIDRFGPRTVLIGGSLLMGSGAVLFCRSSMPWQLYITALVMACGWVCTTMAAISTILALWFDRQRGLAISLALNGASAAGFVVTPLLIKLSQRHGLSVAVAETALGLLAVLVPLVVLGMGPRSPRKSGPVSSVVRPDPRPAYQRSSEALGDWHLWSVALPFALVLAAQVGFLVHLVALLRPRLGESGAAYAVAAAAMAAMLDRAWSHHRSARPTSRQCGELRQPGDRLRPYCDVPGKSRGALCRLLLLRAVGRECHYIAVPYHPARIRGSIIRADGRA